MSSYTGVLIPRSSAGLRWACSAKPNRTLKGGLCYPKLTLHPVGAAESFKKRKKTFTRFKMIPLVDKDIKADLMPRGDLLRPLICQSYSF